MIKFNVNLDKKKKPIIVINNTKKKQNYICICIEFAEIICSCTVVDFNKQDLYTININIFI